MPASPVHSSFQEDVDSPQTLQINSIGALQELCSEKNIPAPQFELKADIGPAHSREFTMECRVASLTAIATELTKKKAKQSAAQIMLHRLVDMLPDEIEEHFATSDCTSLRPVIESDELLRRYNELSTYNKRRTNWGIKMKDSPQALVNLMDEKDIEYEDLWEDIKEYNIEKLKTFLEKLELSLNVEHHEQDGTMIYFMSINSDPDFTTMGISTNENEAFEQALKEMFNFLQTMTKK